MLVARRMIFARLCDSAAIGFAKSAERGCVKEVDPGTPWAATDNSFTHSYNNHSGGRETWERDLGHDTCHGLTPKKQPIRRCDQSDILIMFSLQACPSIQSGVFRRGI